MPHPPFAGIALQRMLYPACSCKHRRLGALRQQQARQRRRRRHWRQQQSKSSSRRCLQCRLKAKAAATAAAGTAAAGRLQFRASQAKVQAQLAGVAGKQLARLLRCWLSSRSQRWRAWQLARSRRRVQVRGHAGASMVCPACCWSGACDVSAVQMHRGLSAHPSPPQVPAG